MVITRLLAADRPYALTSWRESHKQSPEGKGISWSLYKREYGALFSQIIDAPGTLMLGAYRIDGDAKPELLGYLVGTPGKRVDTLHWIQVKFKDAAGAQLRRHGIMTELLAAADFGSRFIYTLRARREGDTSLDHVLADHLQSRGIAAVYEPLLKWIK